MLICRNAEGYTVKERSGTHDLRGNAFFSSFPMECDLVAFLVTREISSPHLPRPSESASDFRRRCRCCSARTAFCARPPCRRHPGLGPSFGSAAGPTGTWGSASRCPEPAAGDRRTTACNSLDPGGPFRQGA